MQNAIDFLTHALIFATVGISAVMILSLFFKFLPLVGRASTGLSLQGAGDLFGHDRRYDLLLSSGQIVEDVAFHGMVKVEDHDQWPLRGLAVFRRTDGGQVFVRLDGVRVLQERVRVND
jgi:hypothetical protein